MKVDVNNDDGKNLPYKFWFKVENLKLLPGKYDIGVSSKNISHFAHKNLDLEYWIALEPDSTYDIVHDEVEDRENELSDSLEAE